MPTVPTVEIGSPTAPAILPGTATATPPGSAAVTLQLAPASTTAGGSVTATGSGWPDGSDVVLSADFGYGTVKLGYIAATGGSFTATITVPGYAGQGSYEVVATDAQGDRTSQLITVT